MKSIALFNNKGGVGKTTIATTVAFELARKGKKVLMVDLDPQSNTTQVVLNEKQVERIYVEKLRALDRIKTIRDVYNPMRDSNEAIIGNVREAIYKGEKHQFKFDILPAHLSLSEFEDTLSDAWSDLRANKLGGFRRTNWFIQLKHQIEDEYDFVIIDLSPSLGALNRSVLLNVDNFVIPITGDIYNLYGVKNIGTWIHKWIKVYSRSLGYLTEDYNNEILEGVEVNLNISNDNYKKFLGYIISRARTSKKTKNIISYQKIHIDEVTETIKQSLEFVTSEKIKRRLELGEIREIISLLTESQAEHRPAYLRVAKMLEHDKKWNKQSVENSEYAIMRTFEDIADNILENMSELYDN
ncbi:ParA family protein [Brochothrix thermosphacta]|uniref:ParA family protein n=1 Tax=Brochothrix thermosphacta TaxID=2756 RepID=UPI000A1B3761|nr:Phage-related regulatory protein cII [Brachybacterium faecium]